MAVEFSGIRFRTETKKRFDWYSKEWRRTVTYTDLMEAMLDLAAQYPEIMKILVDNRQKERA